MGERRSSNKRAKPAAATNDFISSLIEDESKDGGKKDSCFAPLSDAQCDETSFSIADKELFSDLGTDLSGLLSNLSGDVKSGLLKRQLETLRDVEGVGQQLPDPQKRRLQRRLNYDLARKDAQKWVPQIRRNAASLSATFKSVNSFEDELKQAILSSGVTDKAVSGAKVLPVAESIKAAEDTQRLAQLRALLFREHQKAKRMSKIKSKMWRKVNRKAELHEREKLLARLEEENPDLAQSIRQEMEEKRATMRMLKRQTARQKWAKVAVRFGGREMQQVVSREAQREKDEKDAVARIVKMRPGDALEAAANGEAVFDSDVEGLSTSSDDEEEESSYEEETVANRAIRKAAKRIKRTVLTDTVGDTEGEQRKGLMGLKFMQRAVERQRQANEETAEKFLTELDVLRDISEAKQDDSGSSADEEDTSVLKKQKESSDRPLKKQKTGKLVASTSVTKKVLPVIPQSLVSEAEKVINATKKMGVPHSAALQCTGGRDMLATHEGATEQNLDVTASLNAFVEAAESGGHFSNEQEQETLIQEALVVCSDQKEAFAEECAKEEAQDMEELDCVGGSRKGRKGRSGAVAGWGSWAGEGITIRCPRSTPGNEKTAHTVMSRGESEGEQQKQPRIYINRRLDRKLAPYFVKSLPYPYNSKEQFELDRQHPLGPEWNTLQIHDRLVHPKVHVRAGTVIVPLEYGKHLPKEQVDTLLDAWAAKKAGKKVPKARL